MRHEPFIETCVVVLQSAIGAALRRSQPDIQQQVGELVHHVLHQLFLGVPNFLYSGFR